MGEKRLHWRAEIAGEDEEWDAEIVEQVPDNRIAWRSTSGAPNAGQVVFSPRQGDQTEVFLQLQYEPRGMVENVGDALGMVKARVKGDLMRFKDFIEHRQQPTGGWRGEIHGGSKTS